MNLSAVFLVKGIIMVEPDRVPDQPVMRLALATALVFGVAATAAAQAAGEADAYADEPHCTARILTDVPAEEAPEQMKSKSNKLFGPITRIKVDRHNGKMLYCGHNTYCYNSNAFELVTPCRIKRDMDMSDGQYFVFFTR